MNKSEHFLATRRASFVAALLAIAFVMPLRAVAVAPAGVQAPKVTILKSSPGLAKGLIFIAPKGAGLASLKQPGPVGPEIVDNTGHVVWFSPVTNGQVAADFRVQQYQGRPVLTWAQQANFGSFATGTSVDYILDSAFHVVKTVRAGNGLNADAHEFLLTPQGTALITIYHTVPHDLSPVGGPKNGKLIEGVIQEIDVATGKVLFEWHSLGNVGLNESYLPLPKSAAVPWDYIHINAISLDTDGNLLLDARHTSALYKIDRKTGKLIWRLGGKKSDFKLGPGVRFSFQHNAVAAAPNVIRIFDNAVNPKPVLPYSRVIWIRLNPVTKTATLVRQFHHPQNIQGVTQGDAQQLSNGDVFVGWGQAGHFSEFDASGHLLFDAVVPKGYDTYRAYRFIWPPKA